jgi:crotonobetainyl-CoA:carnitine CoA-transferase CaiB-like acyl-CoA transferase
MQALDGLSVLELGEGVAVAFAGKTFADFGADVIKVEAPGGDPARRWGPFRGGLPDPEASATFLFFNRNKRGVTLDPASRAGRDLLARLAGRADLILAACPLRDLAGLGISIGRLAPARPAVVIASLTAFGEDGPYRGFQATELVADAIGGPVSLTGMPDRAPLSKPMHLVAAQVGNHLAAASLAAVVASRRAGEAQEVEVSATEVLLTSFDRRALGMITYQVTGDVLTRPLSAGRASPLPAGKHLCADGYVEIACLPRWVPRMLATLGDPDLDAYFAANRDAAARMETAAVLAPVLNRWLAGHTRDECFAQATLAHGWPVFPVNQPGDLLTDAHFTGRGYFVELDHPVAGPHRQLGAPWRMGDGGFEARRAAPTLGQHNEAVYAGELGMDRTQLGRARALGII